MCLTLPGGRFDGLKMCHLVCFNAFMIHIFQVGVAEIQSSIWKRCMPPKGCFPGKGKAPRTKFLGKARSISFGLIFKELHLICVGARQWGGNNYSFFFVQCFKRESDIPVESMNDIKDMESMNEIKDLIKGADPSLPWNVHDFRRIAEPLLKQHPSEWPLASCRVDLLNSCPPPDSKLLQKDEVDLVQKKSYYVSN